MELISKSINELTNGITFFIPELIVLSGIILLLIIKIFQKEHRLIHSTLSDLILITAFIAGALVYQNFAQPQTFFAGMLVNESFISTLKLFLLIISTFFIVIRNVEKYWIDLEFDMLFLGAVFSAMLLISSLNLIMLVINLEFFSLCVYAMVAMDRSNAINSESSIKYILFGLFCTAITIFGFTFLYGITHSFDPLNLNFISKLHLAPTSFTILIVGLTSVAFLFKVSAIPFHYYVPDVYQGVSYSMIYFLSVVSKLVGIIIFFRYIQFFESSLFNYFEQDVISNWKYLIGVVAISTMLLGNLVALWQTNIKRLLAYSTIAQTGVILLTLFVFSDTGVQSMGIYFVGYFIASLGLFTGLAEVQKATNLQDLSGLGIRDPLFGTLITIFIVSLIGLPISIGFNAKFAIFTSIIESYSSNKNSLDFWVLIVAIFSTLLSFVYLIKIPYYLFFKKTERMGGLKFRFSHVLLIALGLLILYWGIFPNELINFIEQKLVSVSYR